TRALSWIGLAALACAPPNPETETTNLGSSSSSSSSSTGGCEPGALGCPCDFGPTCDEGLVCVAGTCEDDGGTTTTTTTATTTSTTGETSSSTTEESSTTSTYDGICDYRDGIQDNPACPLPEAPYCSIGGLCSDCTAVVSCGALDPAKSVCDEESGLCVECTASEDAACSDTEPLCDPIAHTCGPCTAHDQCSSGACQLDTGACFPQDSILYVFRDAQKNGKCTTMIGAGGTMELPYCTAQDAVSHVQMLDPMTPYQIVLLAGAPLIHSSLDVNSNGPHLTVALRTESNPTPDAEFMGGAVTLRVKGDVTVYADDLDLQSTAATDTAVVECTSGARLYLDHVRAHGGAGPGLRGNECAKLSVSNSSIFKNGSEGIEMTLGALVLRNVFVTDNGVSDNYGGGGLTVDQTVIDVAYSTFFLNHSQMSLGDSIHCSGKALDGSMVRNSIIARSEVIKTNESIVCLDLKVNRSVVDDGEMQGQGNVKMTVPAINALLKGDYPIGAYRLKGEAEAEMIRAVGQWKTGDPAFDFEGDPRPTANNGEALVGADVVAP
ncbi:MAG: hypothetical protein R3B09_29700, partial [Nannocystaceae bacterium]